ncbi:MAG: adenylate kinase family enzyme [Oceanicoccus sp.]
MNPTMIIIGGVPGAGKSTLAKGLSKELNIPAFSKDELEAAVARRGLCKNKETQGVGFEIMAVIAKTQIENDNSAIFDFIASKSRITEQWSELLESEIKYIECICSNEEIHKERIQSRNRNIEGWYELVWEDVLTIRKYFQPLMTDRLILDSVDNLNENIAKAIKYVSQ